MQTESLLGAFWIAEDAKFLHTSLCMCVCGGGGGGVDNGGNFGTGVRAIFRNLLHSYTWPLKKTDHSYT